MRSKWQKLRETLLSWRSYSAVLGLLYISLTLNLLTLAGCGRNPLKGLPKWPGLLWAGNPEIGGIERTQDTPPSQLSASDGRFKNYVSMSYEDLGCLYQSFVLNCRDWFTLTPTCRPTDVKTIQKFIGAYEKRQTK